jgi:hypothetical protein
MLVGIVWVNPLTSLSIRRLLTGICFSTSCNILCCYIPSGDTSINKHLHLCRSLIIENTAILLLLKCYSWLWALAFLENSLLHFLTFFDMKMAVFWVVAPCSLVEVHRRFWGSKYLWNVGKLLPDYTMLHPKRHPFSYSPLWEPQIFSIFRRTPWTGEGGGSVP